MKQGRLGLLLTLTLLLALGTLIQDFRFDKAFANDHDVAVKVDREVGALDVQLSDPVSYTHLTLPTILLV